jgi:DNA-binding beta-propeller fold protein YncE
MSNETVSPTEPLDPAEAAVETVPNNRRKLRIIIAILGVILLILALAFAWYLSTRKPLSQLPVFSQQIPPSYSSAWFGPLKPIDVKVDEANNRAYVSQSSGDRTVLVYDLEGTKIGALEAPGKTGTAHLPTYIAIDPATSDVYVSDRASSTVYIYDMSGNFLRELKPDGIKKWSPLGLAFSKDGTLFVGDVTPGRQRIIELSTDGKVIRQMGAKDQLTFVNGMATRDDGTLIAADSNSGRVLVYGAGENADTALARGSADSALGLPRGVAIDDRGRVYVVDTVNQVVRVYVPSEDEVSPAPVYAFSFGVEGTTDGAFEFPNGVAVDTKGHVYVTDRENNRVQVWSY